MKIMYMLHRGIENFRKAYVGHGAKKVGKHKAKGKSERVNVEVLLIFSPLNGSNLITECSHMHTISLMRIKGSVHFEK